MYNRLFVYNQSINESINQAFESQYQFITFRDNIFNFQLRDNALQTLPNEIGLLRKLVKINLSHNKLTKLPKTFFELADLRQLILSHNQFSEMGPELNNLLMLEELVRWHYNAVFITKLNQKQNPFCCRIYRITN